MDLQLLFVVLIVGVVIDAGAHLVYELRQGRRDARQQEIERDVALVLRVLVVWARTWGEASDAVKAQLSQVLAEHDGA